MRTVAKSRTGIKTSFFGKTHSIETKNRIALTKLLPVKVTNIETNKVRIFKNNLNAAKHFKIGESTLRRYKKEGKILLEKYVVTNV